jgi:hypothetical protein
MSKYISNYDSFKKYKNDDVVNEEIFGAIKKLVGGLIKKTKERINKTKGGKEIETIYQKYTKMINDELVKQAKVSLNILAAANETGDAAPKKESKLIDYKNFTIINEAEVDAKLAVDTLKQKKAMMEQIVKKMKDMAIKEMDAVLKKYGGAQSNPQLDMIIQAKKDQFDMDFMNAQINYLEQAGDKTMAAEIAKQRDAVMKKIEADMKEFDTKKAVQMKEGDEVIYLLKDKKKEDWEKLTPDQKAKPTEKPASDIVGVHKVVKIEGDKYTLEDADGKPTIIKTSAEIIGPAAPGTGGGEVGEVEINQTVVYKRDKFKDGGDEEWKKITDDEKKKPNEGKMKDLQDKEMIGVKKIIKIEGDNVTFEGDIKKTKGDILMTLEGVPVEGKEELQKTLGELKAKPGAIEKVNKISTILNNPDDPKNAEKIKQLEEILKEEGE